MHTIGNNLTNARKEFDTTRSTWNPTIGLNGLYDRLREHAESMLSITNPDFREELSKYAAEISGKRQRQA